MVVGVNWSVRRTVVASKWFATAVLKGKEVSCTFYGFAVVGRVV